MSYVAPHSPHDLIQEHYPGDEYKILICCQLLNQTSRKQLDSVADIFFSKWPTAESLKDADAQELVDVLRPLGFYNRRSKALKRFVDEYLTKDWQTASDLYGCGKYANDAWSIFVKGDIQGVEPDDHALNDYYSWYMGEFCE